MANKPLRSIKFPGLSDTYTTPQVDATLTTTGAAADAKKVGDEITDIKQDLSESFDIINNFAIIPVDVTGYYIINNGSTVDLVSPSGRYANSSYCFSVVPCNPGDVFTINGTGGDAGRLWSFIDENNSIISAAAKRATGTNLVLVAPDDATKLVINTIIESRGDIYKGFTSFQIAEDAAKEETRYSYNTPESLWSIGSIQVASGNVDGTKQNRLHTDNPLSGRKTHIETSEGYTFAVFVYNVETNTYLGEWTGSAYTKSTIKWFSALDIDVSYPNVIKISMHATDDSTFTSENIPLAVASLTITSVTDSSLSVIGIPADSGVVGTRLKEIEEIITPTPKPNYYINPLAQKTYLNKTGISGTLYYHQGFCMYDGYYYSTDGSNIAKEDSTLTVVSDVPMSVGHGNSFQLGHDGLAYISGWDDQTVYVVDLATLTLSNTITLPTTGYTTCAIDDINQYAYIFQRDTRPSSEEYYNFIVYDYANDNIISQKKTPFKFGAMQGCDFLDGIIYLTYGTGAYTATPNGYKVLNTNCDVLYDILITDVTIEPECAFVDRETKELYVSFAGGNLAKFVPT